VTMVGPDLPVIAESVVWLCRASPHPFPVGVQWPIPAFRPCRHRFTASAYRHEMTARFATGNEVVGSLRQLDRGTRVDHSTAPKRATTLDAQQVDNAHVDVSGFNAAGGAEREPISG
jgi:hypothetical protein